MSLGRLLCPFACTLAHSECFKLYKCKTLRHEGPEYSKEMMNKEAETVSQILSKDQGKIWDFLSDSEMCRIVNGEVGGYLLHPSLWTTELKVFM